MLRQLVSDRPVGTDAGEHAGRHPGEGFGCVARRRASRHEQRQDPDDTSRQVSAETLYRSLFIQARGALKKAVVEHLRRSRVMRRSRHHPQKTDQHGRITDTVSISERPASVEDRAPPGLQRWPDAR